ncbi:hypothetical protein CXB35_26010 [Pseudomonas syringae]|nr:hypothetical protein CXB35_26010 [Pseudomonas syringae]
MRRLQSWDKSYVTQSRLSALSVPLLPKPIIHGIDLIQLGSVVLCCKRIDIKPELNLASHEVSHAKYRSSMIDIGMVRI